MIANGVTVLMQTETERKIREFEAELKKMQKETEILTAELENRPLPEPKKPFPLIPILTAFAAVLVIIFVIGVII